MSNILHNCYRYWILAFLLGRLSASVILVKYSGVKPSKTPMRNQLCTRMSVQKLPFQICGMGGGGGGGGGSGGGVGGGELPGHTETNL